MEIDKTLQVKLELEKLTLAFQEEQKNKYSVLNEMQEEVNTKKQELERICKAKGEQFQKLPSLKEAMRKADEIFRTDSDNLAKEMNIKLKSSKPKEGWGPILIEYKDALTLLHNKLNESLLALEKEEKIYNDILDAEEKLNRAIEQTLQLERNLVEQCYEKLQETKGKIIELLQSNFQDNDVLQEQLVLFKQGPSISLELDKSEKPQQSSSIDSLQEALSHQKRKYVYGLKQIDDLTSDGGNQASRITLTGSLKQQFFVSPLKHIVTNNTGLKSVSSYVPVVRIEATKLQQLLSENTQLRASVEEEQTRGADLEKRLELASRRIEELEQVQRAYELQTSEFSEFREAQDIVLKQQKEALTEKTSELDQALKTIQQLREEQSKLAVTCESLQKSCVDLKRSESEKAELLKNKESLLSGLLKKMSTLDRERHDNENDFRETIQSLTDEKQILESEKEDFAKRLRDTEQELELVRQKNRFIETRLKEQMQKLGSESSENVMNRSHNHSPRKPLTPIYDRTTGVAKKEDSSQKEVFKLDSNAFH